MLSENLRFLREEKGVSQQEVADYLKISRQAYNYYENNKRQPDSESLRILSEYFNTTIDDLLNGDLSSQDENLTILNRNAKKLSPENRKKLLEVAKVMFKEAFDD